MPGSVVTLASWSRLRSRRICASSAASANTRAGTCIPRCFPLEAGMAVSVRFRTGMTQLRP